MISLLALAGLGSAIATFFIAVPPAALLKDEIVRMVKDKTGRDLAIAGPISFTLFPSPGLAMGGVSLSGAPGSGGKPLVTMARLEMNVALFPLLARKAEIERLVLERPVFNLEVDREGGRNWRFAAAMRPGAVLLAEVSPPGTRRDFDSGTEQAGSGEPGAHVLEAVLQQASGNIAIEDGTVRYTDARKGQAYEVSAVGARITFQSPSRPLTVEGSAVSSGETLAFSGTLYSLSALLDDQSSKLSFTLEGRPVSASYDGDLTLRDAPALDGALKAEGPAAEHLAAWLGLAAAAVRGPFTIAGRLNAAPGTISLDDAMLNAGGTAASGRISVETGGERPFWRADLKLAELDLGKRRAEAAEDTTTPTDDLPRGGGPAVKGWRAGWSGEPLDWSFLGAADGDLTLKAGKIRYDEVEAGPGAIRLAVKDRTLKATIVDLALYGGRGQGAVSIDATAETPVASANLTAEGVDARAFLRDAAGFDWLSGTAKLTLALSARGGSERQIVETLSGTANAALTDGVIAGLDTDGILGSLDGEPAARARQKGTSFSALTATFTIKAGVAENRDLRMTSALVEASGAGKVLLTSREIDYTLRPRLISTRKNQEAEEEPCGLEVPVRVTGSWDKPKFSPDLKGVMKDPDKAVAAIKEIGKKLKGKKLGDIVRGLLGGDGAGTEDQPPGQPGN